MTESKWIKWPTEPGFYWFFGYVYGVENAKKLGARPELQPVKAVQGYSALVVHYWADFLHRDQVTGVFLPMQPPHVPDLDDMLSYAEYIGLDMSA